MTTTKFDWKITAKKVLFLFGEIVVLGAISYITTGNIAWALPFLPLLEGLRNYIKHKDN